MTSPIPQIYKSILRKVTDTIALLNASGNYGTITFHNFESRGDENNLPKHTLLGVDGFSFDENRGRWIIRFALAVSSYRDANLLNEIELLGDLHEIWGEDNKVPLLDLQTGDVEDELAIVQFAVMPMAQSEIRNYRVIGTELMRTSIGGD